MAHEQRPSPQRPQPAQGPAPGQGQTQPLQGQSQQAQGQKGRVKNGAQHFFVVKHFAGHCKLRPRTYLPAERRRARRIPLPWSSA